ncbi:two pore potassium channel sup-9 [Brachionus plicatilis]|uniref:Two pore potassium channel sup-9 n=1 Tax=Brachionus plicatilis TaxID=10195 RepID=A0A3M7PDV2_BRAPC|nr:two pore potassium channel sup-9 [Brachionus plicatilis]
MKKQNVRTLSFIVSTFTYLLMGAAIFDALESQTEELIKQDLENTEIDYKKKYNISHDEYKSLEEIVNKYHPYRKFPQW